MSDLQLRIHSYNYVYARLDNKIHSSSNIFSSKTSFKFQFDAISKADKFISSKEKIKITIFLRKYYKYLSDT